MLDVMGFKSRLLFFWGTVLLIIDHREHIVLTRHFIAIHDHDLAHIPCRMSPTNIHEQAYITDAFDLLLKKTSTIN